MNNDSALLAVKSDFDKRKGELAKSMKDAYEMIVQLRQSTEQLNEYNRKARAYVDDVAKQIL